MDQQDHANGDWYGKHHDHHNGAYAQGAVTITSAVRVLATPRHSNRVVFPAACVPAGISAALAVAAAVHGGAVVAETQRAARAVLSGVAGAVHVGQQG